MLSLNKRWCIRLFLSYLLIILELICIRLASRLILTSLFCWLHCCFKSFHHSGVSLHFTYDYYHVSLVNLVVFHFYSSAFPFLNLLQPQACSDGVSYLTTWWLLFSNCFISFNPLQPPESRLATAGGRCGWKWGSSQAAADTKLSAGRLVVEGARAGAPSGRRS